MIPVEVTQTPWHYTTFWDWADHWETLLAGFLAFVAGVGTVLAAIWAIWATRSTAKKQIDASREDAERVIAATREQTEVTAKQTDTTVRLQQTRDASEASAFHAMLAAAMDRVLAEAAWARKTYSEILTQSQGASEEALTVRQCITKGAFAELRAACIRQGSPLTGEFLDLEREIDSFALQCENRYHRPKSSLTIRMGKHAGLGDQLALIETKATALREKAAARILMVRITVNVQAFGAIATLPLGSVAVEAEANERGERVIWLDDATADRLGAMRGPGETYSDVILRLVAAGEGIEAQ
jgi:hypothetical protein